MTKKNAGGKEQKLAELVERLQKAFGDRLVSVVLYGSASTDDWSQDRSDLNVLCVVSRISSDELRSAHPILHWWQRKGNPSPLLLTADEVRTSTDCFPMEFHDMQQHRRILQGADVIENLAVDDKFYRAEVEHELRAKQLRLRQRAAEALSDPEPLLRLMTDSISTFCVLGRHALVLGGKAPPWNKHDVINALRDALASPFDAFGEILTIRTSGRRAGEVDTAQLLDRYLGDIELLVRFVDTLGQ
jgi:predicted nucleotidyltransferase